MRAFAILSTLLIALSAKGQAYDILDFYPHEDGLFWTYEGIVTGSSRGITIPIEMRMEVTHTAGIGPADELVIIERVDVSGKTTSNTTHERSESWKEITDSGVLTVFSLDDETPNGNLLSPPLQEYPRVITIGQSFTSHTTSGNISITPKGPVITSIQGRSYETIQMDVAMGSINGKAYMLRGNGIIAMDIEGESDGITLSGRLELVSSSKPLNNVPVGWLWAGTFNMSNGWRWSDWFGLFFESESGWVYDLNEGWLFPAAESQDDVWMYSINRSNWMWTAYEIAPFFWSAGDNDWIWSPRQ